MDMKAVFSRTAMLFGEDGMKTLAASHVAVFGLGGVGGHAAEALVRSGVGTLTVCDNDNIAPSNINRQLFATADTCSMKKTEAAKARLLSINPELNIITQDCFFDKSSENRFDFSSYDYVLDCIDTVTSKLLLIECCQAAQAPLLVCLGTGNKTDPTRLRVDDITKTSVCPLARVMRTECKKRSIRHLRVVWSDEPPIKPDLSGSEAPQNGRRAVPASTAFVPPAAGILMARTAIMHLLENSSHL